MLDGYIIYEEKYTPLTSHSCKILKRKGMSSVKIARSFKCAYIREKKFKNVANWQF